MSLRKTSCAACIAAKRRCDQQRPLCSRCAKRGADCVYSYPAAVAVSEPLGSLFNTVQANECFDYNGSGYLMESAAATADQLKYGLNPDEAHMNHSFDFGDFEFGISFPEFPLPSYTESITLTSPESSNDGVIQSAEDSQPKHSQNFDHPPPKRRRVQQTRQSRELSPKSTSASGLCREVDLAVWPRAKEAKTWSYCVDEFTSYVRVFAQTARIPHILGLKPTSEREVEFESLSSPLGAAYSICAAQQTMTEATRPFFYKLLNMEVAKLAQSYQSDGISQLFNKPKSRWNSSIIALRNHMARVQAMILYHIIRSFGSDDEQKSMAREQEHTLAAWTTELELRVRLIELETQQQYISSPGSHYILANSSTLASSANKDVESLLSPGAKQLDSHVIDVGLTEEERETARRTILLSYMVRAIHYVMEKKICPLLPTMAALTFYPGVSATTPRSQIRSGETAMTYEELGNLWDHDKVKDARVHDKFTNMLLIACKGVGIPGLL